MNDIANIYIDTWNASTAERRDELLRTSWATDATYTDPLAHADGLDGISAVIGAVREQFPDFVFRVVGAPDSHHEHTRFQWGLGPAEAEPIIIGFDVVSAQEDGRIRSVVGFLDRVPS